MRRPTKYFLLFLVFLALAGGSGVGLAFLLWVQPLRQALEASEQERGRTAQSLQGSEKSRAEVSDLVLKANVRTADMVKKADAAQRKATELQDKFDLVSGELAKAQQTLHNEDAQRNFVQQEAEGCLLLALDPHALLGPDLFSVQAEIQDDPNLVALWTDHFTRAENAFTKAIEDDPKPPLSYVLRAWSRVARGADRASVVADLQRALEHDPESASPLVQCLVSRTYSLLGRPEDAEHHLGLAVKAAAKANAGNSPAALPLALAQNYNRLLQNRVKARIASELDGTHQDLLRLLDRAAKIESPSLPPSERATLLLARTTLLTRSAPRLQTQGKATEAAQLLKQAEQSAKEVVVLADKAKLDCLGQAYHEQGRALELLGRPDEALAAYEAAVPLARNDTEKSQYLGACARVRAAGATKPATLGGNGQGRLSVPRPLFLVLTLMQPAAPAAKKDDGDANLDKAQREAEKAIELNRAEPLHYLTLGKVLLARKRYEQAIDRLVEGNRVRLNAVRADDDLQKQFLETLVKAVGLARPARLAAERTLADQEKELPALRQQQKTNAAALDRAGKEMLAALKEMEDIRDQQKKTSEQFEAAKKELADVRRQLVDTERDLEAARKSLGDTRPVGGKAKPKENDSGRRVTLGGKARFLVELPAADARLFVNDRLDPTEGKIVREFLTTALEPGKRYHYELRVEFVRDGRTVTDTRRVPFEADSEQRVTFRGPAAPE